MDWLQVEDLVFINARETALTGEPHALVDVGKLEAALVRPQHIAFYDNIDDLARLGAELCYGIVKAHAFLQGNKRTGFYAMALFFRLNGQRLQPESTIGAEAMARLVLDLTTDTITPQHAADRLRAYLIPADD